MIDPMPSPTVKGFELALDISSVIVLQLQEKGFLVHLDQKTCTRIENQSTAPEEATSSLYVGSNTMSAQVSYQNNKGICDSSHAIPKHRGGCSFKSLVT